MSRIVVVAAAMLGACAVERAGVASALGDERCDERFDALVAFMQAELDANHVPGGALAVVLDGQLACARGFGVTGGERAMPVTPDTRFRIGSTTKMMVAAGVMSAVEDGALDLDAAITDTVPYVGLAPGHAPSTLTTRNLLDHTSSLADWFAVCGNRTLETWGQSTALPIMAAPGQGWFYSNNNYNLAGLVLQEATGAAFESALQQRVFDPLGMTATFDPAVAIAGDHSRGHLAGIAFEPYDDCAWARPAGTLFASVVDSAHFAEMLLAGGGAVLAPESTAQMLTGNAESSARRGRYGLGIDRWRYRGVDVADHGGNTLGFTTYFAIAPDHAFGVVVFSNEELYWPQPIALRALELYTPAGELDPDHHTSPWTWFRYTGAYDDRYGLLGTYRVLWRWPGQLWLRFADGSEYQLEQLGGDWFYAAALGLELHFWPAAGDATYYVGETLLGFREGIAIRTAAN